MVFNLIKINFDDSQISLKYFMYIILPTQTERIFINFNTCQHSNVLHTHVIFRCTSGHTININQQYMVLDMFSKQLNPQRRITYSKYNHTHTHTFSARLPHFAYFSIVSQLSIIKNFFLWCCDGANINCFGLSHRCHICGIKQVKLDINQQRTPHISYMHTRARLFLIQVTQLFVARIKYICSVIFSIRHSGRFYTAHPLNTIVDLNNYLFVLFKFVVLCGEFFATQFSADKYWSQSLNITALLCANKL